MTGTTDRRIHTCLPNCPVHTMKPENHKGWCASQIGADCNCVAGSPEDTPSWAEAIRALHALRFCALRVLDAYDRDLDDDEVERRMVALRKVMK